MTVWPFSVAELTAGLRRYFAEPSLQVKSLAELSLPGAPAVGGVRGVSVDYVVGAETITVQCMVKEPQGVTRAGLAGAGRREAGLYRSLADLLPVATPTLIAADPAGNWLILEAVDADIAPDDWRAEDYTQAVQVLAALHERFWGLGEDLTAYAWLARPLTGDFEIYVYAAAQAVERMVRNDRPRLITGSMTVLGVLGQIISQAESIVQPLRAVPQTLLHGDFWPGNVALQADGDMVVFDWQMTGLGPGILDIVTFVTTSRWQHQGELPVPGDELFALYRQEMARRARADWPDEQWEALWEHALLWRFVQETLGWLASVSEESFAARAAEFEAVWLTPVLAAAERRLRPVLYF